MQQLSKSRSEDTFIQFDCSITKEFNVQVCVSVTTVHSAIAQMFFLLPQRLSAASGRPGGRDTDRIRTQTSMWMTRKGLLITLLLGRRRRRRTPPMDPIQRTHCCAPAAAAACATLGDAWRLTSLVKEVPSTSKSS
jgi:hypothetical protein